MTLWQNLCNYAQMSPAQLFTFVFPSSPIVPGLEILEYLFLLFPLPRIPSLLQLPRNSCFHQDLHWTHFPTKFSMEKSEGSVFLPLLCVCVCVCVCVCLCACARALSCVWLCNPMNYILPGSSIHGILQARILEWLTIPFSRRSSQLRDWTWSPTL